VEKLSSSGDDFAVELTLTANETKTFKKLIRDVQLEASGESGKIEATMDIPYVI
jgi:hypothetical protein